MLLFGLDMESSYYEFWLLGIRQNTDFMIQRGNVLKLCALGYANMAANDTLIY